MLTTREVGWKRQGLLIDEAGYQILLDAQAGVCAVCQRPPISRSLSVDHDHQTGRIRGLLCWYCNKNTIAKHRSPDLLRKAADYLSSPPASSVSLPSNVRLAAPKRKLDARQTEEVIKLAATGVDYRAIGRVFDVSRQTVCNYLKSPEAKEKLLLLREAVKHTIMERTAEELIAGAATVARKMVDDGDAKGLDASTRAILNLEKATASAAGENRKVEVTGAGGAPLQVDVRALVASILDHNQEQV